MLHDKPQTGRPAAGGDNRAGDERAAYLAINPVREAADSAERIAARGGRATRTRIAVLDLLLSAGRPLSHDEVGEALKDGGVKHDRVTLYRTPDWLVGNELAHRVPSAERLWRFKAVVDEEQGHAHFHCAHCGAVFCLESLQPAIAATLPQGFRLERAELTFHGSCPNCH